MFRITCLLLTSALAGACTTNEPQADEQLGTTTSELKVKIGTSVMSPNGPAWMDKGTLCNMLEVPEKFTLFGCTMTVARENCNWDPGLSACKCDVTVESDC